MTHEHAARDLSRRDLLKLGRGHRRPGRGRRGPGRGADAEAWRHLLLGRKFEKTAITRRGGPTSPDPYLVGAHVPGQPQNIAGVNDPRLTEMIKLQRRTFDVAKRREIVYDIQRHLAQQVYYLYPSPSAKVVGAWEPYVKNYMPNVGNDYGGRMMAAWLDK
jgi:ABC-type transport system substrate-binding protein